jgi:uncharacterized secreted protein with C-terminal beta-propeller domain
MKKLQKLLSLLLTVLMLVSLNACVPMESGLLDVDENDYSRVFAMIKAATFNERNELEEKGSFGFRRQWSSALTDGDFAAAETMGQMSTRTRSASTSESTVAFSDTNNQIAGVQESDIVKTDGTNIYIASASSWNYRQDSDYGEELPGRVSVVKVQNGKMELIAQIKSEDAEPAEMLLYDGKLIVIWSKVKYIQDDDAPSALLPSARSARFSYSHGWGRVERDIVVEVYDTDGDFGQPVSTYSQRGFYTSSRMIDNYIYIITNFNPQVPPRFREKDLEMYVPSFEVNGRRSFVPANAIVIPEGFDSSQYSVIGGLDVTQSDMAVTVMANLGTAHTVYSSLDNIYVISSSYDDVSNGSSASDRGWWSGSQESTVIDKFSLDKGEVKFVASGKVVGSARNQFRFDEHDGILRVVTEVWGKSPELTDNTQILDIPETRGWWDEREGWGEKIDYDKDWGLQGGSLFTFDENMNVLAQIHRIGFGENVQSVRFMGNIGYVVTFWQTDPLFSFDLSDPKNPVQLDELKIPGFSRYLHSWADGLLLGMGVEAEEEFGQSIGLKLSMFDTSDNENLSERHTYVIGGDFETTANGWIRSGWYHSPVEYDHKAALVVPERNIIGFPYDYSDLNNGYGSIYAVFAYGEDGFVLIGEIKSPDNNRNYYHSYRFNRGLFIGDYLYAIAEDLIISAELNGDSLGKEQSLKL